MSRIYDSRLEYGTYRQILDVLMRYSDRDVEDLLPERKNANELVTLLCSREGREKYIAWQKEYNETWKVLRSSVGRLTALACDTCKGTGQVPLLTSVAPCPDCQPLEPLEDDACLKDDACLEERLRRDRSVYEKRGIVGKYLKTPEGRRKLAARLTAPRNTPFVKLSG